MKEYNYLKRNKSEAFIDLGKHSYEEFYKAWRETTLNRKSDCTLLYVMLIPYLTQWEAQLNRAVPPNFSFQTLHARIASHNVNPDRAIKSWIIKANRISSVKEELELILFKSIRWKKWFPKFASPKNAAFVFHQLFLGLLEWQILKASSLQDIQSFPVSSTLILKNLDEQVLVPISGDLHYLMREIDYFHLKKFSAFDFYLMQIMLNTSSAREEITSFLNISERKIREYRTDIWNSLKHKL